MAKVQTMDSVVLKTCTMFGITLHAFRNHRKGSLESDVNIDADKARLRLTKKLVDIPEYNDVMNHLNDVKNRVRMRSAQSYITPGLYFVKTSNVEKFEVGLAKAVAELHEMYIPALQAAWPAAISAAKKELRAQFRESDYPTVAELPSRFGIEWRWLSLGIPDNLPSDVKSREEKKFAEKMKDAEEQILAALREAFADLIAHAVERLSPDESGKPKVLRDAVIDNAKHFFATFEDRNILNDEKLSALVQKAKDILGKKKPEDFRSDVSLRAEIAKKFGTVKSEVDKMIALKPSRKFDLED